MISVYSYTDYRTYLRDWYQEKKAATRSISYRVIAQKIGFRSPGHFTLILQGKTHISVDLARKFADYLKLNRREREYFELLVLFNRAKSPDEKDNYFEKLSGFQKSAIRRIKEDQFEYYNKWYHSAIRAILAFRPICDNFADMEAVACFLQPSVTPTQVKDSVELMARLGIVTQDQDGCWRPADQLVTTGYDTRSVKVANFLLDSLKLSSRAVEHISREKRNISCLTLGISQKGYTEIQAELRDFRRRVMEIAARDRADSVYQFSLQLFPLTRTESKATND